MAYVALVAFLNHKKFGLVGYSPRASVAVITQTLFFSAQCFIFQPVRNMERDFEAEIGPSNQHKSVSKLRGG